MANWTTEMWQIAIISLIVGIILGYGLVRLTKGSVKKQAKTESELKQVKAQVESQKAELEKHFAESAELLKTLAKDYQTLYQHFAYSSTTLLPELADKPLFNQLADNTVSPHQNTEHVEQVRDYSEGSSGLLKTTN